MATRGSNLLHPFGSKEEEDRFLEMGLLHMLERQGNTRAFTLQLLPPGSRLYGGKGIGEKELRKANVHTPEEVETFLLRAENAGRHLGKNAIRHLLKHGRLR